ncbi:MAG: CIA30 family protein [Spirochaetia bacterium]|nr:CIA30 family protein [Spirochaetia bacterium]
MKKLTLKVHIGDCTSAVVTVDGVVVPSSYNPATKICMFTAAGDDIVINRAGYTGGATNAVTKATLYNDMKWAYSFTFDDGRPNDRLVALPVLTAYGYRAGVGLNTQQMTASTDGYVMSWASADILRAAGWSFFDHNYSHANVTCANISTETAPVKTAIESRWPGYLCTHFVYPYCDTTNWTCIRDSGYFVSAENYNGNNYADVLPTSPFLLNRNSMMAAGNAGTAALANALADNAASDSRARWMIMFTHDVAPGSTAPATTYDTNEAVFGAHIQYLYNTYGAGGLNNMWFAPSDEVMHYMLTREYASVNYIGSGACGAITPATPTITHTNTPYMTPTNTPLTSDCLADNMDDGDMQNNFDGYWFSFAVGVGSAVIPSTFAMASGGYGSSPYAARLNGTVGTVADYSQIVMATQLNGNAGSPANGGTGQVTNISGCEGLSFYVKGDGKQYYVKIPYTDVNDNSMTGYNDYNYTFTATAGWTLVTVPFTSFTQAVGWGTTVPLMTVLQNAKQLQFSSAFTAPSGTVTADLWVDNLYITRCGVCPGASTPAPSNTATVTATSTVTPNITTTNTRTSTATTTTTSIVSFTATPSNTGFAGSPTFTQTITVSPTAGIAGRQYCVSIDYSAVPALVNKRKLTLKVNVGVCDSVSVTADGLPIVAAYKSSTGEAIFTTNGNLIVVTAINWTSGGTGAVVKAVLQDDKHWAFSQTFDDEYLDVYTQGKPLLDAKGWKAGIAVVNTFASASWGPQMSWTQMEELWADGWDMYNHSNTHPNLNCTNFMSEFQLNQTALQAHFPGYNASHIVYPFEDTNCTTCSGFPPAYLMSGQRGTGVTSTYVDVPIADLFKINRTGEYGLDLTSCKNEAAAAAANPRPSWIIKITHHVYPGNTLGSDTLYSTTHDALSDLYNYLDNNFGAAGDGSMWFAPAGEVMDYIFTRDNAVVTGFICGTPTPTYTYCAVCTATFTLTPSATKTSTPLTSDCVMDDMEDNNNENGFGGYWFTIASGTGASVVPAVGSIFTMTAGGYNSLYAARMNGTVGVELPTYPSIAMVSQLNVKAGPPLYGGTGQVTDISGCGGVRFWAKGDGKQYYFRIPYTDVDDNSLTGYCDYKAPFTAPAGWTLVTIPFSSLTQETWGTQVDKTTVLQNAKVFQFVTAFYASSGTTTSDLWIDDVVVTACGVCPGAAVPTPVNTSTMTRTATNTPTATCTSTPTGTATDTLTVTSTSTITVTGTYTDSPTETPYAGTPTDTWTVSPTSTVTDTETASDTPTQSMTVTPTATVTDTNTATATGTLTTVVTYTPTPTKTPSLIPTATSTPTLTFTNTPTTVNTATFTLTNTVIANTTTLTITVTTGSTATSTLTPAITMTPTAAAALDVLEIRNPIAFPNPAIPSTGINIGFMPTQDCDVVTVSIYTVSMRLVRRISTGHAAAMVAAHRHIDASEIRGLAAGTYYYVISGENSSGRAKSKICKMIIIK